MNRIRLGNTVFEGLNNVYLLDGDRTVLVDTGVALPEVREELDDGLADHGLAASDVDAVFLTHWHPDHAGLAGDIQAASDCEVYVHEADAPIVAGDEPMFMEDRARQDAVFDDWGIPEGPRTDLQEFFDAVMGDLRGSDADVTPITDGDRFDVNGTELEAVHLPGHAAGLTAFAFDAATLADPDDELTSGEGPEAFVGDAVLPRYTPNVGGADVRLDAPLERYGESLVRVVERDFDRLHPGHREVIDDPSRRAAVILEHHRERTERVVEVLREHGPSDAWTVSAHLFGDLENVHILHGPGEAYAHLDHLHDAGVVERDGREYVLVDDDPDIRALFPETRFYGEVDGETEGK